MLESEAEGPSMHKIEREHREYVGNRGMWKRYRDL